MSNPQAYQPTNQLPPLSPEDAQTLMSLFDSVRETADKLEESIKIQVMNNCDQVFHVKNIDSMSQQLLQTLKTRQETLVRETLRRNFGRFTAIRGSIGGILQIFNKYFPE